MPEQLIENIEKQHNQMLKLYLWVLKIHISRQKTPKHFNFFITSVHRFNLQSKIVIVFLTKQFIGVFKTTGRSTLQCLSLPFASRVLFVLFIITYNYI